MEQTDNQRRFLPQINDLCDRLSIVLLKSILIPENRDAYRKEMDDIKHDIDLICNEKDIKLNSDIIFGSLVLMLINREIWLNESKARSGGEEQNHLLSYTHSLNGLRCQGRNLISSKLNERKDLKVDCLASTFLTDQFIKEHGNWNIFGE